MSEVDSGSSQAKSMDGIHVSVRIRPLSSGELSSGIKSCCSATSKSSLMITKEGDSGAYLKSQATSESEFAFDAVFDENASQTEVYNKSAKPYLAKLMMGENVTIFAYGATGAGKTHTMFGHTRFDSTAAFAGAGIIPQSVADLFRLLRDRQTNQEKGETWAVRMSYMEVYNEQVCDLLEVSNKNLPLREDPERGVVIVAGLSEHRVASYDEVLELLMKGQVNRKTEATKANIVSSRSHAILQFAVTHTRRGGTATNITTEAKLSLIDLAGSERASATQNTGARLQEGANINKSLLALANCINALSERAASSMSSSSSSSSSAPASAMPFASPRKGGTKKTNVKYRDSKLTHLLKGSLEGNCNLVMIANVNPADTTQDDTYRTLQYANRAKNLKVKPGAREIGAEAPAAEREARLKEENEELRVKLLQLEQNAQQSNASEQQLLQALAQALEALNAAKAKEAATATASPPRSPMLRSAVAVAQSIFSPTRLSTSTATSPMRTSPVRAGAAPPAATTQTQAANLQCADKNMDSGAEQENPHRGGAVLSGKKTKRESLSPLEDRLSFSCHPRVSTGSTMSQLIYGADGEDSGDDDATCEDEDWRRMSEGAKSRRTSLEASPCKHQSGSGSRTASTTAADPNRRATRSSTASSSSRLSGINMNRLSSGSVNGSSVPSLSFAKPTRLSKELVQQYEVLANVTGAANRRTSNAENRADALSKGRDSCSSDTSMPKGRGSFPSSVSGTQWEAPGKALHIDARYQYSHGTCDASPPKQGFLSRFLCGLNKKR